MSTGHLVGELYERYQARDWDGAVPLLHVDAEVLMPATDERLAGRDAVLDFQRAYPEPWGDLVVLRVADGGDVVAAELEIVAPGATFRCAAFWTARDGLLHRGVEYWVTVGGDEVPPGREARPRT